MKTKTIKPKRIIGKITIENPFRLREFSKLNDKVNFWAKYKRKKYLWYCNNQNKIKTKIKEDFPDIIVNVNLIEEDIQG